MLQASIRSALKTHHFITSYQHRTIYLMPFPLHSLIATLPSYNDTLLPTHLLDDPRPHLVHGFDQSRVPELGSERREDLEVEQPLGGRGALFFESKRYDKSIEEQGAEEKGQQSVMRIYGSEWDQTRCARRREGKAHKVHHGPAHNSLHALSVNLQRT